MDATKASKDWDIEDCRIEPAKAVPAKRDEGILIRRAGKVAAREAYIGCPIPWLARVAALLSRSEILVALVIYRKHVVQKGEPFKLSNCGELGRLGVPRWRKPRRSGSSPPPALSK